MSDRFECECGRSWWSAKAMMLCPHDRRPSQTVPYAEEVPHAAS